MRGLRPPERDIGPARRPAWAALPAGLFAATVLACAFLDRLGLGSDSIAAWIAAAAALGLAAAAILSPVRRSDDFIAADREAAPALAGFAGAAGCAGLLAAGLASGLLADPGGFVITACGLVAGILAAGLAIAPGLRRSGALTLGDFLQRRFGAPTRLAGAAAALIASLLLAAAALASAAGLAADAFGPSPGAALLASAAVVALTLLPGGMRSMNVAQLIQYGLIMIACLLATAYLTAGGDDEGLGAAAAGAPGVAALVPHTLLTGFAEPGALPRLILMALGAATLPATLVRATGASSPQHAAATFGWMAALSVAVAGAALALGGIAAASRQSDPIAGLIGTAGLGPFVPILALLPPVFAGLLLAALLAALLGLAQAAIFAAAGALACDLLPWRLGGRSDGGRLFAARIMVIAASAAAAALVGAVPARAPDLLGWALAASVAGLFAPLVLGLWWRGCSGAGACLGSLAGLLVTALALLVDDGPFAGLTAAAPAFGSTRAGALGLAVSLGLAVIGSLLMPERRRAGATADNARRLDGGSALRR